ncbi:nucleotide disphospho-sugar-binding domain-containing protein [Streptomyces sp. NPDC026206]|uniref:nucleotide disphospho-sugar-binding domain-containing protein n=1 Tax=Streptomyces sp. NPDC026206 TaxID=3157089 RepID=UPI0033F4FEFC
MRILLTTAPMYGHVLQLVPLSWALRSAGHEVLLAAPAGFASVALAAGLPAVENGEAVSMSEMIGFGRDGTPVPWPADPREKQRRSGRGFGRLAARTLERTVRIAGRWRPDLVISEPTEYAGRMAAAHLGVAWVEHGWGLTPSPLYEEAAGEELAPELARLGLPGLPAPRLVLDVCPPRMQHAHTRSVPTRRMRYVPYNGSSPVPPWTLLPRDRPRVCVTLGSVLPTVTRHLLDDVLLALTGLDAEVVLAMDTGRERGPLPPAVRAAGWLPLNTVLPACDLVVHHGGPGTTMTALVHGLPQLILPHASSDMAAYAEKVSALGAGRALPPAGITAAAVEEECRALLRDPTYRDGALSLAAEIARQPSPAHLVPALKDAVGAGEAPCAR